MNSFSRFAGTQVNELDLASDPENDLSAVQSMAMNLFAGRNHRLSQQQIHKDMRLKPHTRI